MSTTHAYDDGFNHLLEQFCAQIRESRSSEILAHMRAVGLRNSRPEDRALWLSAGVPAEAMSFSAPDPQPAFEVGEVIEPAPPRTEYDRTNGCSHEVLARKGSRAQLQRYDYGPTDPFWIDVEDALLYRRWTLMYRKASPISTEGKA